ncbi:MAG: IS110 family transposase [Clostridia bacterium]|nr:IS110 family transposase [Clostridia bacterium]
MYRILKIGMDVHTTNFTLCALESKFGEEDQILANITAGPDHKNVLDFIRRIKEKMDPKGQDEIDVECGYEAGCLGYSLFHTLTACKLKCRILAPTTMLSEQGPRIKTDRRDAKLIAQCLSNGGYHAVYIPTAEDNAVKEYVRMRDDHKLALKKVKQQTNALCLRFGFFYDGTHWTGMHLKWLRALKLPELIRETLDEHLATYDELTAKIDRYDRRIQEIAAQSEYKEKVRKLECFLGIKTHTALSLIVETGDFIRFRKGNVYAAYLGLAPGEHSSAESGGRLGITKAGNSHLRRLLIEAAGGICKGQIGKKSKDLIARQKGNLADVIAYADKGNVRLRSKYYRLTRHGKKRNVAVAAVARELACFVWGMMTDNIHGNAA